MRILITGGAGFIGSHWVDYLIKNNLSVTVIDNLSSGFLSNLNKNAAFYKTNITNYKVLHEIFKNVKPYLVYHLAANTNAPLSVKNPLYDFQTLRGSLNVIHLCNIFGVKRIVYTSSGFIYGNTKERPTKESETPKPLSPYGISKRCIEDYLRFYKTTYNLEYVVLRPSTVYGPRQRKGAIADYIDKLSKNLQAEIYGDGSKTRDYLFIEDFIEALARVTNLEDLKDPVFNVGTAKETSLKDLYSTIAELLHKKAKPIYKPERAGELQFYSLDYSKIHKAAGWKPKTTLAEGLKKTLDWWRSLT